VSFTRPNRVAAEFVRLKAGAASLHATGIGNTGAARFDFEGGVGAAVLDFTGAWSRNASGAVKIGLGSVKLIFPRDLGVRLSRSSFLANFNADGLVQRDGEYYSRNWDQARHRLNLEISAALGSVEVEWVD
jgi:predicted membrane protein